MIAKRNVLVVKAIALRGDIGFPRLQDVFNVLPGTCKYQTILSTNIHIFKITV